MALPDNKQKTQPGKKPDEFEELVHRAENAMQGFAQNYDAELAENLDELKLLIDSAKWDEAQKLAYKIKIAAGTFGWPRCLVI